MSDIDMVRRIEGFPVGSDEEIIALSDAPYRSLKKLNIFQSCFKESLLQ